MVRAKDGNFGQKPEITDPNNTTANDTNKIITSTNGRQRAAKPSACLGKKRSNQTSSRAFLLNGEHWDGRSFEKGFRMAAQQERGYGILAPTANDGEVRLARFDKADDGIANERAVSVFALDGHAAGINGIDEGAVIVFDVGLGHGLQVSLGNHRPVIAASGGIGMESCDAGVAIGFGEGNGDIKCLG